ncbi:unnamed protein product [Cuscuta campestris]|uniref:Uncharacterized protein n=1 Tax=Cuscuta campestris TaxID=132261 RepID=A0A484L7G2_9ASTE|nr:unnamed protein product [Cuscuta campestris]
MTVGIVTFSFFIFDRRRIAAARRRSSPAILPCYLTTPASRKPEPPRRCFLRQRSAVSISTADDGSPRRAAVRRLHCQRRSSSSSSCSSANRRCFAFAGSPPLITVERRQSPPAVALSSGLMQGEAAKIITTEYDFEEFTNLYNQKEAFYKARCSEPDRKNELSIRVTGPKRGLHGFSHTLPFVSPALFLFDLPLPQASSVRPSAAAGTPPSAVSDRLPFPPACASCDEGSSDFSLLPLVRALWSMLANPVS